MPTRDALSNFFITIVALFFMALIGMLLKACYRLPSERQMSAAGLAAVPKAIPIAIPVDIPAPEPRGYQEGGFWVLPHPQLVPSRGNEADTLRIRSGPKEDVFVLYFVDALEATLTHPKRISQQSAYFGNAPAQRVIEYGGKALAYVSELLTKKPFVVYTKKGRVPESERFYAMISVEMEPGKMSDLGELLVRKGYAEPIGQGINTMPGKMKPVNEYLKELKKAESQAKAERAGLWVHAQ